ncbi:MAG TPA: hypothetical protein VN520_38695 [Streptomyces sp.]|uniref:hypothetical protein n=1 Tax=Streptomyces sp. TaxID=1931 RepID=UPI002B774EDF|nr:hypothetical protein [Streptomyces sp.]HWU12211.1 hypothetical protein [Streptomyces sp.]
MDPSGSKPSSMIREGAVPDRGYAIEPSHRFIAPQPADDTIAALAAVSAQCVRVPRAVVTLPPQRSDACCTPRQSPGRGCLGVGVSYVGKRPDHEAGQPGHLQGALDGLLPVVEDRHGPLG